MKKRQNNSARASALQITLAVGLLSIAAILFASSFRASPGPDKENPASREAEVDQVANGISNLQQQAPATTPDIVGTNMGNELEPNNTFGTANFLGVDPEGRIRGNCWSGVLASAGVDEDWFSFTTSVANSKIYAAVTTSNSPSSTDSVLAVIASDGTTVLESDANDGSFGASSSTIAGTNLATAGTYYLRVTNVGTTTVIAPYELYVAIRNIAPTAETEPNNNGAPQALPASGYVTGVVNPAADTDTFTFNANAGDTIFLSQDLDPERDVTTFNGRIGLGLFGTPTQFLVTSDAGTGDTIDSEAMVMTVDATGVYQVYVDDQTAAGSATSTYTFSVTIIPAAAAGTCTTYTNSTSTPLTDAGLTTSSITIPDSKIIRSLRVVTDITHANYPDLDVHLRSPSNNDNGLYTDIGVNTQTGAQNINLNDEAALPAGLFTNNNGMIWRPETYRLHWFRGENSLGTWNLDIRDDTAANVGTLNSWSLEVCEEPPLSGSVVYTEDFEANNGGYTHSGTADEWEYGTPNTVATTTIAQFNSCASGLSCWKTDLDNTYDVSSNQDLVSPAISLAVIVGPINLYWQARYQTESVSFDRVWVRVTQVGNPTHTRIVWHNDNPSMSDSIGTPSTTFPESAGWGRYSADISDFAGQSIQVTFHLESDSSVNYGGFAIDDVTVRGTFSGVTPSPTPTATATFTPTPTATAINPCFGYTYTVSTGSIVPGTTDTGNHTDDGSTVIALPFSYTLYEQTFNNVAVGSNGHLTFGAVNDSFSASCLPQATTTYAIFPYRTDLCTSNGPTTNCASNVGTGYGIFTSISGVAPNRIFNIEWRAPYYNSNDTTVNFEVRLFEGQTAFDVIYGTINPIPAANDGPLSVGVQRNNTGNFTLVGCDPTGGQAPPVSTGQLYHYTLGVVCPSPTPTATATATMAPTATPATVCTLTEGFDVIANLGLAGWTMQNNSFPGGLTGWFQGNSDVFPAHTGAATSYIGANFNNTTGTNTISNWLLTPPVTVQNGAKFGFFTRTVDAPSFPDRLQVRMSTNGTSGNVGSSPTDVGDFTNLLLDINPTYLTTGYPNTWTYFFVTVSGVPSPVKGRMAFRYFVESGGTTGANSDYIGIDQAMYDCTGNLATPSPTATFTPTPTATITATATATATASASPTPTATATAIVTPTPPCGSPTTVLSQNWDGVVAPALPVGWVASNAAGTDGILWVTSSAGAPTPAADSPPNSAFVNDPGTVHDKLLDSPTIAINGPAQLSFRNYYNLEESTTVGTGFDGGVLEIKIGAGAFTDIITAGGAFVTNGYNDVISTSFSSPLSARAAWSGNSGGFVTTTVNLPAAANGQNIVLRWRMGSDSSVTDEGWRIDNVALLDCPPSTFSISGTTGQCNATGPSAILLDGVTVAYTGAASGSTVTAGGGLYTLSGLVGGNYTVTPSKANRPPGSAGINTTDVIAIQRHFLILGTPLTGCRLLAADCAAPVGITTGDVIAAQRYFLVLSTGIGNVGRYSFTPTNRTYSPLASNQTAQDYSAIVFGDVATPFAFPRPGGPSGDAPEVAPPSLASVAAIELPSVSVDQSRSYFSLPVRTTQIDAQSNLVGFQGDLTFDERVVTFQNEPVRAAGLTANNWNVSANVIPGNGPIRTLRISAYSNTFAPLSGSGTLFELNMTRVSKGAVGTRLTWAPAPDQFIFIDADLNTRTVGNVAPGGVNLAVQR